MKAALIQTAVIWEEPRANREHFESLINSITEQVDLIVLPEMFSTGFSMNPSPIAETMQGETVAWMIALAKAGNIAITGSVVITENDKYYNRMLFVFPDGRLQSYDKRHLFTLAGEDKIYTPGKDRLIVEYKGFKICPLICYDLRFPVFSRNTADYDLLIYSANWPKPRTNAWDILLRARSVENMCYTIGVNRVGSDNNNHEYIGHSQVVDFLGDYVSAPVETAGVFIVELNKQKMLDTRAKLAFLDDKDRFEIR